MADRFPLDEPASVVLDGSGNGTVTLTPTRARQVWHVTSISVHANRNPTNEAECQIFVNGVYYAGTFSGSSGDNTACELELRRGNTCTAVWTGGDVGQVATLVLKGAVELE